MDPVIKAQWIEDLRSGKYLQGSGYLRKVEEGGDRFCCLGVLCELAVAAGIAKSVLSDGHYVYTDLPAGVSGSSHYPPQAVYDWAGIKSDREDVVVEGIGLATRNDDGKSFAEIADIIEEKL